MKVCQVDFWGKTVQVEQKPQCENMLSVSEGQ